MHAVPGFGKPSRPRNSTAVATRKVQAWLSEELGEWAAAQGGVVRAEEVECDIPGCAPIETLLAYYAEGCNQVTAAAEAMAPVVGGATLACPRA